MPWPRVKTELNRLSYGLARDHRTWWLTTRRRYQLEGALQALGWVLYPRQIRRPSRTFLGPEG